jgi:hypothetical protein
LQNELKEVEEGSVLDPEPSVHVKLTELQFRIEAQRPLGARVGEADRNPRPAAIPDLEDAPARGHDLKRAALHDVGECSSEKLRREHLWAGRTTTPDIIRLGALRTSYHLAWLHGRPCRIRLDAPVARGEAAAARLLRKRQHAIVSRRDSRPFIEGRPQRTISLFPFEEVSQGDPEVER